MNYGIALGEQGQGALTVMSRRGSHSMSWGEKQRVLWIFWSLRLTPLRSLMDRTICKHSRCMCEYDGIWGEAWVYCSYVEVEEMKETGCVCACLWRRKDRASHSVHFITLLSSRGSGECRGSCCGQQRPRWLDELHLSKWTLLISTSCYMEHPRTWWV